MAKKIVFFVNGNNCVEEVIIDFHYVKGMAFSQRVKCADSLAESIKNRYPEFNHLEISTKSRNELGKQLSAFNLMYEGHPVESIFQSSKVFENNVQFGFLINSNPLNAKKFINENRSGNLIKFKYKDVIYPINPQSAFYDWVYIKALHNSEYAIAVTNYSIFSDIEFNYKKSINCQARAAAIYVSIVRQNKINYYLSDFENFKQIYQQIEKEQLSLFD